MFKQKIANLLLIFLQLLFLAKLVHSSGNEAGPSSSKPRKALRDLIVLTDMQPDDRIALAMIGGNKELSKRLLFVGTTLLNTERKKALAERQLKQMGLNYVQVHAGTGVHPSNYPLNVETAKAAFSYRDEEGRGILPNEEWEKYKEETDQTQSADENDFYQKIHLETTMADPENINRSFLITNLPESSAPNMVDRYKEDRETVIKLLDMLNIGFRPKYVYRLPKQRGILDTSVRRLKVVFPIHLAIAMLWGSWRNHLNEIRKEFGPKVSFGFPIPPEKYETIKEHLASEIEKVEADAHKNDDNEENKKVDEIININKNEENNKKKEEQDQFHNFLEHFHSSEYDADDLEELRRIKKEKKKMKKKEKRKAKKIESNQAEKEEIASGIDKDKDDIEEKGKDAIEEEIPEDDDEGGTWAKVERNKANKKEVEEIKIDGQMVKEVTLKELINFLTYNEEENAIIINGLAGVDEKLVKASKRQEDDFKAACELLYAIGVELPPLAVKRTAVFGPGVRTPPLKVFMRNKKSADLAVALWEKYSLSITRAYKKPEWEYAYISPNRLIRAEKPNVDGRIVKKLVNTMNEVDDNAIPSSSKSAYLANRMKNQENIVNPLQHALKTALITATKENPLEILLLTAPTDLVQVLVRNPQLCKRVRVHLMVGWTEKFPHRGEDRQVIKKGTPTIWSNYNLAMAPESTRKLFQMNIPMRLYTYRDVREAFNGSVNASKFRDVIKMLEQSQSQVMKDFLKAAKSWDNHVLKTMPYLNAAIEKYGGKQFNPADPMLVVGLLSHDFLIATTTRKVNVEIAHAELSMGDVLEVQIDYDIVDSKIELVTCISRDIFHYEVQNAIRTFAPNVKISQFGRPRLRKVENEEGVEKNQKYIVELPCIRCKQYGHKSQDCPVAKKNSAAGCFKCGMHGHIARNCPNANRP